MRLLLDTHAFVWWTQGDNTLSVKARTAINDSASTVFISAASAWEITTKHRLGKMPEAAAIAADVELSILDNGFKLLPISVAHAQRAGALPGAHGDPFDRMLAAQALLEGLMVVTRDKAISAFGAKTLW